ncbi:MAG: hypothetical protein FWD64_03435 [Acidobacteriaceae bacterium]|nr:hypothetical protein [Acidobacteriaceae bacterium]
MKKILAVAAISLLATSVAFGQAAGTTTTSTPCDSPATAAGCSVDGQTLLVASYQEGLTLTVPNQINFALVPGQLNQGSQPLTAVTTWVLDPTYTNIWVDAFFKDAVNSMTASDPGTMGANIGADSILAQQNGMGGTQAFDATLGNLNPADPMASQIDVAASFPIKNIDLSSATVTSIPTAGGSMDAFLGSDSSYLNLYIDLRTTSPIYGLIFPNQLGTWAGYVYVRAQAY